MIHTDKQLAIAEERIAEYKATLVYLNTEKEYLGPMLLVYLDTEKECFGPMLYQVLTNTLLGLITHLNSEIQDYKNAMDKLL